MNNYSLAGITIASMLDTRREKKDGMYPVKIRVTFNRKRVYYSTGISMVGKDWEKLPKAKSLEAKEARKSITNQFDKIKTLVIELEKNDVFSFESLNQRLGRGGDKTINNTYQAKIDSLNEEGKHNTSDWYKYSLKALENFKGKNIKHNQITIDFLKQFEAHLLKENKSYTTISMYMRALQSVVNDAKELGLVKPSQYPFGENKYKIPQHSGRAMALTLQGVGKIVKYECIDSKEQFFKDAWFFLYLCNGLNVVDFCQLKYKNIRNGEISFYRQKTIAKSKVKKEIVADLTPEMSQIIEKYGNPQEPESYIFPILEGSETPLEKREKVKAFTRSLNHYMSKIGKRLELGNISTYTARHSFATILKRSGANVSYISESLGHTDLKTTENYLASFESEERKKNSKILTSF